MHRPSATERQTPYFSCTHSRPLQPDLACYWFLIEKQCFGWQEGTRTTLTQTSRAQKTWGAGCSREHSADKTRWRATFFHCQLVQGGAPVLCSNVVSQITCTAAELLCTNSSSMPAAARLFFNLTHSSFKQHMPAAAAHTQELVARRSCCAGGGRSSCSSCSSGGRHSSGSCRLLPSWKQQQQHTGSQRAAGRGAGRRRQRRRQAAEPADAAADLLQV